MSVDLRGRTSAELREPARTDGREYVAVRNAILKLGFADARLG
jgi:hypothetical protein